MTDPTPYLGWKKTGLRVHAKHRKLVPEINRAMKMRDAEENMCH
jgi:hypothetical protein